MGILSFFKSVPSTPRQVTTADAMELLPSPYVAEYLAAIDRTQRFGFEAPMRVLVRKDCVDMDVVRRVLLDYFERSSPESMMGQTAAINFALVPLLYDKTGIPFNLTIGWMVRKGKAIFQHDESLIQRFVQGKTHAWLKEGCPFHLWLDLAGMRDPRCDLRDELGMGQDPRGLCSTAGLPIGPRAAGRLDLSPDADRPRFFLQDGRGIMNRPTAMNAVENRILAGRHRGGADLHLFVDGPDKGGPGSTHLVVEARLSA